jgi:uncharacterized protein (DUF1800 family)
MTADAWVNTGALLNRMNFALLLVGGGQAVRPNQGVGGAPNRPNAAARAGQQQTRTNVQGRGRQGGPGRGPLQVDIATLAPDTSEASRDRLVDQVLAGDASDATRATLARAETPQQLVALTLGAPEFQRR